MAVPAAARLNADEYLAWEAQQPGKNEYVDGEVFAMVGVTRKHATVAGNVFNILFAHLGERPCRVYMADMKLRVEAANAIYYPDVFVTCDPRDHQAVTHMSSAVLVLEVLSESTAAYDRGDKFSAYRKLPGLKECVLVDPERKQIECFRRGGDGLWVLHEPDSEGALALESVDLRLTLDAVFRRVE